MAFDEPRALILLIILLIYFLSPNASSSSQLRQQEFDEQIVTERFALEVLKSSSYQSFDPTQERWLNLTGLKGSDGFAWDLLPKVQDRANEQRKIAILDTYVAPTNATDKDFSSHLEKESERQEILNSLTPFKEGLPMYRNVTSVLRGKWVRSSLDQSSRTRNINLTAVAPSVTYAQGYKRNITGGHGDLRIKLNEQSSGETPSNTSTARKIKAEMVIKDKTSSGDGWDITMHGVHLIEQGAVLLSTTSTKFAGVFALPNFVLSAKAFEPAQSLLTADLNKTINKQESTAELFNPWTSTPGTSADPMTPVPHCECIVYLQQHPSAAGDTPFQTIETELRNPTGARLSSVPPIQMSALIFSPDCGFVLESKGQPDYSPVEDRHLTGKKLESYLQQARHFVQALAILVCLEVFLLKKQIDEASTPSTKSRISFCTIVIMALGDGLACISFAVGSVFVDGLFLPIAAAFVCFLCVSFFGIKFFMDIWKAQAPERQEHERERQRSTEERNATTNLSAPIAPPNAALESTTMSTTAQTPDTLPLPVTARRPNRSSTPIIITPDQDVDAAEADDATATAQTSTTTLGSARREMGALYTRFCFLLLGLFCLCVYATSWPTTLRSFYCNLVAFIYLSFWVPQLYRNVVRNCRKALLWRFIIGQSLLRLAPLGYFYIQKDNILYVEPDDNAFLALVAWVWLQVFILATQEVVGPRLLVPVNWVPKVYDYHPILREGDGETGGNMPVGISEAMARPISRVTTTSSASFSQAGPPSKGAKDNNGGSKRTFDCAVCTEDFEVPVIAARQGGESTASAAGAATIFARRAYMVTPCRHIFHSTCLQGWMRYRLQCPICRESLPPL